MVIEFCRVCMHYITLLIISMNVYTISIHIYSADMVHIFYIILYIVTSI